MDLSYQMKLYKDDLINTVYGELNEEEKHSYSSVFVELCRDMKKTNFKYEDKKIRIFNLYRSESEIINSLIMGIAHHIDFCIRGETDSSYEFLKIYQEMLFKALKEEKLDFEELKVSDDYKASKMIQTVLSTYWPDKVDTDHEEYIELHNAYSIKEKLKTMDYKYNEMIQVWEKKIMNSKESEETEIIKSLKFDTVISFRSASKLVFGFPAFICLTGNTYPCKDIIKEQGYRFEDNQWVKKIHNSQFMTEKEHILAKLPKAQGIKVEMTY